MMSLFDEDEILKTYIISELRDAAEESARETERKTAARMIKKGKMTLDEIADCVPSLSYDELRELEAEVMQLV